MTWSRALGWLLVLVILAGPIVALWLRHVDQRREATSNAAKMHATDEIKQQLVRIEQAAEVAYQEAQTRASEVLLKIRELKDSLSIW